MGLLNPEGFVSWEVDCPWAIGKIFAITIVRFESELKFIFKINIIFDES